MWCFRRNNEISEIENPENQVDGNNSEVSEDEGNPEEKLSSADRNRNFRDSLKVDLKNKDDGTDKLETANEENDGDEPGPRERSLPEEHVENER